MATKSKKSPAAKTTPKKAVKKASVKPARKPAAPAPKAKKPTAKPVKKSLPAKKPAHKAKQPTPKKANKSSVRPAKAVEKSKPTATAIKTKKPPVSSKIVKPLIKPPTIKHPLQPVGFLAKQRARLLTLKDTLLDSMNGVAKDSLRSRAEGSEASAFGMHQADAGSDAYDRDFALSLLSQEQDSLYEIDEALKRIDTGSYGICEISGKPILHARLEALPFTRYTVECQSEIEKKNRYSRVRQPVASLFGLGDDEGGDGDDDDSSTDSKD